MSARPLYETLAQGAGAIWPPEGTGLRVSELELELPLEVSVVADRAGRPVAVGGAPFTRWVSGVLPVVHRSFMRIALVEEHDEP